MVIRDEFANYVVGSILTFAILIFKNNLLKFIYTKRTFAYHTKQNKIRNSRRNSPTAVPFFTNN